MKNSDICIAQFYTHHISSHGYYAEKINKKYADTHGYKYFCETNTDKILHVIKDRAPTWYKVKLILDVFELYNPEYVLFLDTDAVVVDFSQKIQDYIDPDFDAIFTEDYSQHSKMNAGVFIIKNTLWSKQFLNLWWNSAELLTGRHVPELNFSEDNLDRLGLFKGALWQDQSCVSTLYKNLEFINNKIKIIDHYKLNWKEPSGTGNFIFHAFCYNGVPYRSLDKVYEKLFNIPTQQTIDTNISQKSKVGGNSLNKLVIKQLTELRDAATTDQDKIQYDYQIGLLKQLGFTEPEQTIDTSVLTEHKPTLSEIAKKYPTDKDFTHNYYNLVYEKYFSPIQDTVKLFCEIGIGGFSSDYKWVHGNSLKVFRDYFYNAQILGLDIRDYEIDDLERITVNHLDQSNIDEIKNYAPKLIDYDVILDDGSHNVYDQQITFAEFFKSLKSGGIYIIEDLHSSIEVNDPEKVKIWGWGEAGYITPLEMLHHFKDTGKIISDYLTEEDKQYLEQHIESIEIFYLAPTSITSVITKK